MGSYGTGIAFPRAWKRFVLLFSTLPQMLNLQFFCCFWSSNDGEATRCRKRFCPPKRETREHVTIAAIYSVFSDIRKEKQCTRRVRQVLVLRPQTRSQYPGYQRRAAGFGTLPTIAWPAWDEPPWHEPPWDEPPWHEPPWHEPPWHEPPWDD